MSRILKVYPKDIFDISEHFIKVVFPFAEIEHVSNIAIGDENGNDNGDENGNENNDAIKTLNILRQKPDITAKALSELMGISSRKVSRIIKNLKESGKITRVGSDRKGYWQITVRSFCYINFR